MLGDSEVELGDCAVGSPTWGLLDFVEAELQGCFKPGPRYYGRGLLYLR